MDIIEKKKIKGYLTVNRRIIFEDGIYHVTQRAPGKEVLFLEEPDYLHFLSLLKETIKKFNLKLFCFTLLTNHLHLLLKIKEKNLSQAMKNLFERYADYFNKKYKRKGYVFCGRYRASLCNDENYLLAASLYIHLNAYNAGLCKDFKDYRWSSVFLYTESSKKTFVDFEEILSLLSSQIGKAREGYIELLREGAKTKEINLLQASFVERAIKRIVMIVKKGSGEDMKDLDKMIDDFKVKKRVLWGKDKRARKYLIGQLKANGCSVFEIMKILAIGRTTYYRIMGEVEQTSQT